MHRTWSIVALLFVFICVIEWLLRWNTSKRWMAIDTVTLYRFFIAHSVLTFVPFDSASASICTWLSVFQSYHWKPDFYYWRFTSTFSSISTSYSSENFSKYTDLEIFEVCFCLYLKTLQLFLRDKYLIRHGEDYRPLRYMIRHFYRL